MIALRLVVGPLRAARLAFRQKAAEADADGRPCCALTWWQAAQYVTALLEFLTSRPKDQP